jgi:hypothetical protein
MQGRGCQPAKSRGTSGPLARRAARVAAVPHPRSAARRRGVASLYLSQRWTNRREETVLGRRRPAPDRPGLPRRARSAGIGTGEGSGAAVAALAGAEQQLGELGAEGIASALELAQIGGGGSERGVVEGVLDVLD